MYVLNAASVREGENNLGTVCIGIGTSARSHTFFSCIVCFAPSSRELNCSTGALLNGNRALPCTG